MLTAKTLLFTLLALIAFAANSLLGRQAMVQHAVTGLPAIDPFSFTLIRLISGTLMLALLCQIGSWWRSAAESSGEPDHEQSMPIMHKVSGARTSWGWLPSLWLAIYALGFSFAYVALGAGFGALILFAAVQFCLLCAAVLYKERLTVRQWTGAVLALAGLCWLLLPQQADLLAGSAPDLANVLLMIIAGICWGLYTLAGRHSRQPLQDSRDHFGRALLWLLPLSLLLWLLGAELTAYSSAWAMGEATSGAVLAADLLVSTPGIWLAVASGALSSALGYALWYQVLAQLSASHAAAYQLSVPVLAALGGAVWLDEPLTAQLIASGGLVLVGIGLMSIRSSVRVSK